MLLDQHGEDLANHGRLRCIDLHRRPVVGSARNEAITKGDAAGDEGALLDPVLPAPPGAVCDHAPLEVGDGPKHVLQELSLRAIVRSADACVSKGLRGRG